MIRILFFLSGIFFFSCNGNKEIPQGVLPPEKMEKVLWDVLQADEVVNYHASKNDPAFNKLDTSVKYYRIIFKEHGTSEEQFRKSLTYYESNPGKFKVLLDSLEKHAGNQIINDAKAY